MTEHEQRQAVVSEAMTWLGTPYHPRGTVKGAGVDCGMLPMLVYKAAGIIPADFTVEPYAPDWHLHKDEERYLPYVERFGRRIGFQDVQPGDFAIWKYGRAFSHGAIFTAPPLIVHAVMADKKVVLGDVSRDSELMGREALYFSPWGQNER